MSYRAILLTTAAPDSLTLPQTTNVQPAQLAATTAHKSNHRQWVTDCCINRLTLQAVPLLGWLLFDAVLCCALPCCAVLCCASITRPSLMQPATGTFNASSIRASRCTAAHTKLSRGCPLLQMPANGCCSAEAAGGLPGVCLAPALAAVVVTACPLHSSHTRNQAQTPPSQGRCLQQ